MQDAGYKRGLALSKKSVIYHRGERRARRVLRLFQSFVRKIDSVR